MGCPKDSLGDYVRQVRESTQKYAKDLLAENEKLLALALAVNTEKTALEEQVETLRAQLERYRGVERTLIDQVADVEKMRSELSSRYVEVELANSNLANLYVASYGIHSSLNRDDVVRSIHEILVNLVGSEEFAIIERPVQGGPFVVASSMGVDPERRASLRLDQGRIADALCGMTYVRNAHPLGAAPPDDSDPIACIPLTVGRRVHGAIVVFRLLAHKPELEAVDQELFDMLGTHAASALYCCELHARVMANGSVEAAQ